MPPDNHGIAATGRLVSSLRMEATVGGGSIDAVVVDSGATLLDPLDLGDNQIEEVYLAVVAPFLIFHD